MNSKIDRLEEVYKQQGVSGVLKAISRFIYYEILIRGYRWINKNLYERPAAFYLKSRYGRYFQVKLLDYKMLVDLADPGISRELALRNIREEVSYLEYREALKKYNIQQGRVNILEIGANIGYYALLPPSIIEDTVVYCAEPSEKNIELLNRNIELNNLEKKFKIDQVALSDIDGEQKINISSRSNAHTLKSSGVDDSSYTKSEVVKVRRGETWLSEQSVDQVDIDVLRMDIEGAEIEALNGLPNINPSIVHIEIHGPYLSDSELDAVIHKLESWDLDLKVVADNEKDLKIESLREVPKNKFTQIVMC